jgi:hypothetical protein
MSQTNAYGVGGTPVEIVRQTKVYPLIGERVRVVGCYSEMMMHFRLAGRPVEISLEYQKAWRGNESYPLTEHAPMCQVWKDGEPFSGLILPGEGGFYRDDIGFYCYPNDGPGDADPEARAAELIKMIDDAIAASGVPVTVITNLGL